MFSDSDLTEENVFTGSDTCSGQAEADGQENLEKLARDNHK
jgi:hypothetical protein